MTSREQQLALLLESALEQYARVISQLDTAYTLAKEIDLEAPLSQYDEIVLEAFTSRFARALDIHLKKLLRLIEKIELEEKGTIIDLYNRAEQRGLISSASNFRDMRELRNTISHEYKESELPAFHLDVLTFTPALIRTLASTKEYVARLLSSLS